MPHSSNHTGGGGGGGRGSERELATLHGLMATYFHSRLASGEPLTPSELNTIRQFLKDNGIDCVGRENPVLNDITKNLPTFEEDEEGDTGLLIN